MRFVRSDDELAFVLGHEIGHVSARHHVAMIEHYYFMGIVIQIVLGRSPSAAQIAELLQFFLTQGFSRENEFEADRLGVMYAHRARFDASAGLAFMERLRAAEGRDPSQFEVLFRTHPGLADRMVRVQAQLVQLGYRVNVTRGREFGLPASGSNMSLSRADLAPKPVSTHWSGRDAANT